MWSGQGPDPEEWYQDACFWRWGCLPLIVVGMGVAAIATASFDVPNTEVSLRGVPAVLAGAAVFFVGALVFGLMIALYKRLS